MISRYVTPHGSVTRILDLWEQEAFDLLVSKPILQTYARVVVCPRHRTVHKLSDLELAEILDTLRELALIIELETTPAVVLKDLDDDHFLACAESCQAGYIVSDDPHLRALGVY
jgi:putative PIN family toxin of toxin-antitoxin system